MILKSVNLLCAQCKTYRFSMIMQNYVTVCHMQKVKNRLGLSCFFSPFLSVKKEVNVSKFMYTANDMNTMHWYRGLSDEDKLQMRRLQFEYEIEKAEGHYRIPENVPKHYWREIFNAESFEERLHLYADLFEKQKEEKKQFLIQHRSSIVANQYSAEIKKSGILKDTYIYAGDNEVTTRQTNLCLQNSLTGSKFGRPIVFVCSQSVHFLICILECAQHNQYALDPFAIHLANSSAMVNNKCAQIKEMIKEQNPFIMYHSNEITDYFPKDKLVYIHRHSDNSFDGDSDDIPVFTADWTRLPLPQGVRTAHLPLRRYIRFGNKIDYGIQSDLPYLYRVLLSYYKNGSWAPAFTENLPPQTVYYTVEDLAEELKTRLYRQKKIGGGSNFIQHIKN